MSQNENQEEVDLSGAAPVGAETSEVSEVKASETESVDIQGDEVQSEEVKEDLPVNQEIVVTETHPVAVVAEVPSAPASLEEPAAVIAPVEAEASVEEVDLSEEEAYLQKVALDVGSPQALMLEALKAFSAVTAPGLIISPKTAVTAQYDLFIAFRNTLRLPFEEFRRAWNVALVYFFLYHGGSNDKSAINERYCNRFPHAWSKDPDILNTLMNIFALLRITRDPQTRKLKTKVIMLDKVGPGVLDATSVENLKKFYDTK